MHAVFPSVLWRCWFGGRKGIRPVKNWWCAGMVICLEWGADLHMTPADATATHCLLASVKSRLVFTARCYASAVLAMGLCSSVCLCLSQAGVLLNRQNVGSHKQHHTIAQGSSFLMPKISAKFERERGHPLGKCRMQVGWVKIGNFGPIANYISKTVQDRHIVSIKVE